MNWTIEPLPTHGPLFEGAIAVYGDAFAEPPYSDPDRGAEIRSRMQDFHGRRGGFRAFVAVDDHRRVRGMTYGYHGAAGQWWHDTVAKQIPADAVERWLSDSYEVVEVAVSPSCQGQGIGTALIDRLLDGRPETTCVLSTRVDSRAHVLYRRIGFEQIVEMAFAVRGARFYIMGKRLRD
jgi:ribosomal protein S18 acetylase RimI-like enzyme